MKLREIHRIDIKRPVMKDPQMLSYMNLDEFKYVATLFLFPIGESK